MGRETGREGGHCVPYRKAVYLVDNQGDLILAAGFQITHRAEALPVNSGSETDFSTGRHREMLKWQRRQMWTEDDVERFARWLNLSPGLSALDVGCGLGYLGYTFWPHFGRGGEYFGIDIRPGLIEDARSSAATWATGGAACFVVGSVYSLPFENASMDLVMCQTLFIHLEHPAEALAEMVRVLRPGGRIFCLEPDNLRPTLVPAFSSLPEPSLDVQLLMLKVNLIANAGRKALGRGDNGIAPSLPHLLMSQGIEEVEVRVKERVPFYEPPYPGDQQERLERLKKYWLNDDSFEARLQEHREEFLAGGGDTADFNRLLEVGRRQRAIQLRQIEAGEFYLCGAYPFYLVAGRKPT
jgi:SAM-dependent methyltransferase